MSHRGAYDIEIANSQSALPIDDEFIRRVAETTLASEKVASATISVAIVDNATIRVLNRRHLDHDYDTDVLSFLLDSTEPEKQEEQGSLTRGTGKTLDGEVVVSAEMAMQQAEELGCRPQDELALYLVHGLLHLAGYDDTSDAERVLMREREKAILGEIGAKHSA